MKVDSNEEIPAGWPTNHTQGLRIEQAAAPAHAHVACDVVLAPLRHCRRMFEGICCCPAYLHWGIQIDATGLTLRKCD